MSVELSAVCWALASEGSARLEPKAASIVSCTSYNVNLGHAL